MGMSKKDFIALADSIRDGIQHEEDQYMSEKAIDDIVAFCHSQNPRFMESRWRGYLAGTCGSNGGQIKKAKTPTLGPCSCRA